MWPLVVKMTTTNGTDKVCGPMSSLAWTASPPILRGCVWVSISGRPEEIVAPIAPVV